VKRIRDGETGCTVRSRDTQRDTQKASAARATHRARAACRWILDPHCGSIGGVPLHQLEKVLVHTLLNGGDVHLLLVESLKVTHARAFSLGNNVEERVCFFAAVL
jgi:hypothetical protein